MFSTRITELFGIEHPIVQGGMQWVATAELTAAVANAGALGFLTALSHDTPEDLCGEIRRCRQLTDRPFGVNVTLLPTLREPDYLGYLAVCAEEGIPVVETAGRNPEPLLPTLQQAGIKVIHKCTSVRHALKAESLGCDVVSIDGFECAGHPGEDDITSLILVPRVADAVDIPVLASGGFGDGRGLVAALALGADGINMGTRFVATREAPVHDNVKQALVDASELDTRLVLRSLRNTLRVLDNATAAKVLDMEAGGASISELAPLVSGASSKEHGLERGDLDAGLIAAGQVTGLVHDIPSVAEVIQRIVTEAAAIAGSRLPGLLSQDPPIGS